MHRKHVKGAFLFAAVAAFSLSLGGIAAASFTVPNPTPATASADQIVLAGPCVQVAAVHAAAVQAQIVFAATPAPQPPAGVVINDNPGSTWLPVNVALGVTANVGCLQEPTYIPTSTVAPTTSTTEAHTTTTVHVTTTTRPPVTTTTVPRTTTTVDHDHGGW